MNRVQSGLPNDSIISRAFEEHGLSNVVKWDVVAVEDGACVRVVFESASAEGRHGIWLMTDGMLEVNGVKGSSFNLWQDSAPACIEVDVQTSSGRLHVYNIWDTGAGRTSQAWTSGMLVEHRPDGRRYCCNDIGLEGAFNSLIFRLEPVVRPGRI